MTRELSRLGVDLGTLDAKQLPNPSAPDCPGARIRVTKYDYDTMVAGGERFVQDARTKIPHDGYGDARVRCDQPVEQLAKTASRDVQYYGLCHSCSAVELRNREDLRERAKTKGDR